MTDLERRVRIRLMQDEMDEKMHQMEIEESIAHLMGEGAGKNEKNVKQTKMDLELELRKKMLGY